MNSIQTASQIEKLNRDISLFPQVTPITSEMHMTKKGVSRLVMLDRYSFKDTKKITLDVGDLVIVTYRDDPKFPGRGYGTLVEFLSDNEALIELDPQFEGGAKLAVSINAIDKPLEIFYEQICARVAYGLAAPEKTAEKRNKAYQLFYQALVTKSTVPAGRVLYGAGSDQGVTFFNCYVMPHIHDSRGGIADHRKQVMEIMSRGGGKLLLT